MSILNLDVVPELVDATARMEQCFAKEFIGVMQKAGAALKNTEQDGDPVLEQSIEQMKKLETNYNGMGSAMVAVIKEANEIQEVKEALARQQISIDLKSMEEASFTRSAAADKIKNL